MYSETIMYQDAGFLAEALRNTLVYSGSWRLNNNALTSIPVMAIFLKYCNDNQKGLEIELPEILQFVVLNQILPSYLPEEQLRSFFDRMQEKAGIHPESGNIFSHVFQDNRKEECALCLKEMLCVVEDWELNEEENGPVAMCAAIQFLSMVGRSSYGENNGLPFEVLSLIKDIIPHWTAMKCYSNSARTVSQVPYITATTDYQLHGNINQLGLTDAEAIALMMSLYPQTIKMFIGQYDWLPEALKGEEGTFDFVLMAPGLRRTFDSPQTVIRAVEGKNESLIAWWPEEPGCKEWIYARNMISLLSSRGAGCILFPLSSLAKIGAYAEIRKKVLEEGLLKTVIELPTGAIPQTAAKVAILIIEKSRDPQGVFMVNLDSEKAKDLIAIRRGEFTKFDVDEIARIVNERGTVEDVAKYVPFDEIGKANFCLSPSAYIFESRRKQLEIDLEAEYEVQNRNVSSFMLDTIAWDSDILKFMQYKKMNDGSIKEDANDGTAQDKAE